MYVLFMYNIQCLLLILFFFLFSNLPHLEGEDSGTRCLGVFWIAVWSRNVELTGELSEIFSDLEDREDN